MAPGTGGVVLVPWYATIFRQDSFAEAVSAVAPLALRYGATRYQVLVSRDDRYKINHFTWFESRDDWYRFWEGPEMNEFRARNSGRYQIPVVYVWHEETAYGELGPEVPLEPFVPAPEPEPAPPATA